MACVDSVLQVVEFRNHLRLLRPDLDLNPVSTGDAEPHSDDVWRGTAGGPATKALGDMNAVKAALPL